MFEKEDKGNMNKSASDPWKNTARKFEELHIFQEARALTNGVHSVSRKPPFSSDRGLSDQIRRACISIMSNIAEGYERGATKEFIQFLYIAKGSCGEIRAQIRIAHDQKYVTDDVYDRLCGLAYKTGGMISNFIAHLQGTGYKGEKYARPKRMEDVKKV